MFKHSPSHLAFLVLRLKPFVRNTVGTFSWPVGCCNKRNASTASGSGTKPRTNTPSMSKQMPYWNTNLAVVTARQHCTKIQHHNRLGKCTSWVIIYQNEMCNCAWSVQSNENTLICELYMTTFVITCATKNLQGFNTYWTCLLIYSVQKLLAATHCLINISSATSVSRHEDSKLKST